MRLGKYLAVAGVCSRRAAEALIAEGRVTLAGAVITDPARDVSEGDPVALDGRLVAPAAVTRTVLALHKPAGVVSTASDPQGRRTVVSLVGGRRRLYPVGRLDIDTTGLLLLTDDGELAHLLTHPRFEVPKTYRVRILGAPIADRSLRMLRAGVRLEDGLTAPAQVRRLAPDLLQMTIHEGRKRQIRRMCEAVGYRVRELRRVAIGPLELGDLAPGATRPLTPAEIAALRAAATDPGVAHGRLADTRPQVRRPDLR